MRDVLVGYLSPPSHFGRYSREPPQAQCLSALVAMHMDNPCEYDDWKSTTERTLSVP